ncbi:MAG: hypothetical protein ACKVPJ_07800 [Chitinophagales bacterium]
MKTIKSIIILFSFAITHTFSFSQTRAIVAENLVISIPVDSQVVKQYLLDLSAIPFTTAEQMEMFFEGHKDDVVDFLINRTERKVYMILNLDRISREKWAVKDINRYLEAKAVKMREVYLTLPVENK